MVGCWLVQLNKFYKIDQQAMFPDDQKTPQSEVVSVEGIKVR